jgi:hypothetical protein
VTARAWSRAAIPWRVSLGAVLVATAEDEPVLEGTTAAVWELLDQPRTEAELIAAAATHFSMDAASTSQALAALVAAELCRPT